MIPVLRSLRRVAPVLGLGVFSLIVTEPLARGWVACTDDIALHLNRAVELERLIRLGHWLPRWAPDMAAGFGYPLFNYYPSLSVYALVGAHALGFNYDLALHLVFFIALLGSALAAYALGRELWGEAAGLVAGVGYLSAPYFAFDALFRGALAETFAWIWPPLILWATARAVRRNSTGWGLVAAASYAGLMLTHNNMALIASPLFAAFGALLAWEQRSVRALLQAAAVLVFGLALAAFFWVPAMLERDLVQTDRLLVPPIFTYYTNFVPPAELLALPTPDDPALINPSPAKALGLIPALLAVPALIVAFARRFRDSGSMHVAFFGVGLIGYSAMTLAASRPLWDHLPLLPFVQFPWRMLSLAALCASLLAGAGLQALRKRGPLAAGALSALLLLANLPWWYPRYCSQWQEHDIGGLVRYERDSGTIGTTAKGEFLPVTVKRFPEDDRLAEEILAGREPRRVDEDQLPAGAVVDYASTDPLDARFNVSSPQPFTLVYRNFYFPGWRVTLDDLPVPIRITSEYGLISFDVPAGEHRVRVFLGSTPIRDMASVISIIAWMTFASLTVIRIWRRHTFPGLDQRPRRHLRLSDSTPLAFALLPALLLIMKVGWIDKYPNPLRHSRFDGGRLATARFPLRVDYAGGVSLHGFDLSRASVPSGEALDVALYVSVREHTERRFQPTFKLEDENGTVWSSPEEWVPRWHRDPPRTPLWPPAPESYAQWARQVSVLPGTPPGRYRLWLTVFDLDTLQPDSVLDEAGNRIAPRILLGEVEVTRPTAPAETGALGMGNPLGQRVSDSLTLLGYDIDRSEARPGDTLALTLFWRADRQPDGEARVALRLHGESGATAAEWTLPLTPNYPADEWQAGDVWRGPHAVTLPPALESGRYRWGVSTTAGSEVFLSETRLRAADHVWEQTDVQVQDDVRFGEIVRLVGHTIQSSPDVSISLVWQPTRETPVSYSVFVHAVDAAGRTVAQSDAIPAAYDRPTTSWLPGEFIVDRHELGALPPGEYQVFVGLYEARSGVRLAPVGKGAQEDNRVTLGTVEVAP